MTNSAWPHWEVHFDKNAKRQDGQESAASQLGGADITDLIVMSHGWNNDETAARSMYQDWFAMLPPLLPEASIGTVGVFWPSMQWPDEPAPPTGGTGGAASLAPSGTGSDATDVLALSAVYQDPAQKDILGKLAGLLGQHPDDPDALTQFHDLMKQLAATEPQQLAAEDDGASAMLAEDPRTLAMRFADGLTRVTAPGTDQGGAAELPDQGGAADLPDQGGILADDDAGAAAGIGGVTRTLWNGAKEALRQLTYWMMKHRAGTVGQQGLAPYLSALMTDRPQLRIHLVGHSFGARLVSYVLPGLASNQTIASLTLLQGAFSHYAFAPTLPQDGSRSGALAGMNSRVSGPLVACYSSHDLAVGYFYPLASMAAHDDASALSDFVVRWGGMGHDGAQSVPASSVSLGPVETSYPFTPGQFTNIDCSGIVCAGGPPAGAHSDIFHPELARVLVTAAGLAS